MKKTIRPIFMILIGFVFGRINFLEGIYPFGIALLCVWGGQADFFCLYSGCIIGGASAALTVEALILNVLPYGIIFPEILLLRKYCKEHIFFYISSVLIAFSVPALILNIDLAEKITLVFSGMISACLVPLMKRLYISFEEIENRLALEHADILALCTVGGLIISSLPRIGIFGFDLCIFALLFSSSLSICGFGPSGSIWSTVCGIIWVVKGGDFTIAMCLITGGILGGMISKKRGGVMLGYILGDLLISLFVLKTPVLSLGILNLLFGCGYTVFLKKSFLERLRRFAGKESGVNDLEMNYIEGMRKKQTDKLESAGRMYNELANAFITQNMDGKFKDELVASAMKICENCNKKEYCLTNRKSDTVLELDQAAESVIDAGKLSALPITLTARCIHPVDMLCAINENFERLKVGLKEKSENEIAMQLKSISEMLFSLSKEISTLPEFDKEKENEVKDVLNSRIGRINKVVCRKSGESHLLEISLPSNYRDIKTKICDALENGYIGSYVCLSGGSDRNGGFFGTFAPKAKFSVSGFAKRSNKNGESICGDSFSMKNIDEKSYIAAISDGAGSGIRAKNKSESTLDLLDAFSETGMKRNEIFKAMNRLLLCKGGKEDYSTVDVAEFDLDSGLLYWTKIGAVPGYILRGEKVEKVETGCLPMGIVTKISPATTKKLVQDNDIIVLVSDGIYDGLCSGNEDQISAFLSASEHDPELIANALLQKAQESEIDDDKTVIVLKVEKSA